MPGHFLIYHLAKHDGMFSPFPRVTGES
ncbi:hypothetical protein CGLO_13657 [Colletotrichum gloeosporioides Cg-14]|uniref:Uncharacterized protein n=1 Tax=Colletotrichum gloeosporioides (strain Cg-14) TaxID=1237896 RepID=T0L6N5_COLGC|nr:hypothetical protein CGLO_13657 [Colletotrichum gloeosporioides Cg-14]